MRRRRTAALYSKSALRQSQHLYHVTNKIIYDRLLPRLHLAAQGTNGIDGLELSYCICSDYLSSFLFGYSNGTDFLSQPRSAIDAWRRHYENYAMCHEAFFVQELPWLYKMMKKVSVDLLPTRYADSRVFLEQWMAGMALKADNATDQARRAGLPLEGADEPVVYEMARAAVERDSPHLSKEAKRQEVASEMFDHICTCTTAPN